MSDKATKPDAVLLDDQYWMRLALQNAEQAARTGEVPVGAVVVCDGKLLASAYNQPIAANNPCGHAEILAMQAAATAAQNYRIPNTTLYVTLEPCTMCFGAMIHARIGRLVYGAREPKAGVIDSKLSLPNEDFYNHTMEIEGGILATECGQLLSDFFAKRRAEKKANN